MPPANVPYRPAYPSSLLAQKPSQAVTDVLAERRRQCEVEGWTPQHDDSYEHMELAYAASAYAGPVWQGAPHAKPPIQWPWDGGWWKPTTPRRDLVKAAALIIAEIERIDRAAEKGGAA